MAAPPEAPPVGGPQRYPRHGDLPASGEVFLIPGSAGDLEAVLGGPLESPAALAVICHPHPLHGGTRDNKVVHTVARAFSDLGALTLRFNFRGVGHSQGGFDHGLGETEDLQEVVWWLQSRYPQTPLWLAGFSFGAAVVLRAGAALQPQRILLVAPPVTQSYFPRDAVIESSWMVVQGGDDEVISAAAVSHWVEAQGNPPDYRSLSGAGHFFHGRLIELRDAIKQAWGTPF